MEGRLWTIVLDLLPPAATELGRFTFDDRAILMIGLWAILRDRPFCWACDKRNWDKRFCPEKLPHPSTLSRRWRRADLQTQAETVHAQSVKKLGLPSPYAGMDGKPLPVARHSKDPDARCGRGIGGMQKGYKMHTVSDARGVIAAFEITSLSVGEPVMAKKLMRRLAAPLRIVADTNFDSQPLRRCARRLGLRLYTGIRNNRVGRRQQPERLHMLRLLQRGVGQRLLRSRRTIEQRFGQLGNFACGFKGLPNWCRRRRRVQRWMWGKVIIYHAFLLAKRRAA